MKTDYPFNIIGSGGDGPIEDPKVLARRPFADEEMSFAADAPRFVPGDDLKLAINTAIAVGEPLLITGEPGSGKTQAAYYVAYKLGLTPVIHFQVKSDSTAGDLLYHFDTVRYFHDSHLSQIKGGKEELKKADYVERRELWKAFDEGEEQGTPRVLLIDEIDKAPRDFPNDLLHELDKMSFKVAETATWIEAPKQLRPIVFITSNSERRLPEPFLRRCVYHNIRFDDQLVRKAVEARRKQFESLDSELVDLAIKRFLALRDRVLSKQPATGELLVWLRVLALTVGTTPEVLKTKLREEDLSKLPHLGVLLKNRGDLQEVAKGR